MGHEVGQGERQDRRALPAQEGPRDAERQGIRRQHGQKRADTAKGKQFSKQPKAAAEKSAAARKTGKTKKAEGKAKSGTAKSGTAKSGTTKAELMRKARAQNVPGRSKMSKAQLEHAVHA